MDVTELREIAALLAMTGALGAVSMALYKAALRHVDWDLIPRSAMSRVHWWSAHAPLVLRLSLALAILGLATLGLTDLAT
jgi:hypothetical protein